MLETTTDSSVLEFYNDSKIFITGGTGFLGKILVEKFLRICTNTHVYLLIRTKKGKDPDLRMKELFDEPKSSTGEKLNVAPGVRGMALKNCRWVKTSCYTLKTRKNLIMKAVDELFSVLRKEKPDFMEKVTCIPGDTGALRLAMSDGDYEFLANEVTHVFHSAATVRFNEQLKTAVAINVLGTQEIVKFCKKCHRLKVFVHISTAFSNCVRDVITEDFYDPPLLPEKAITLVDTISEDKLISLTTELIKPWPNTYTFTKAIAENIIKENARSIPAVIIRPSIVIGTVKDPVRGWIDNIYGPTGIIAAVAVGLMRVFYADYDSVASVVPADLTVNAILSCAWDIGSNYKRSNMINNTLTESAENTDLRKKTETIPKIFNFVPDKHNLLTWGILLNKLHEFGADIPSEKAIWHYTITLVNVKWLYYVLMFLFHFVPGYIVDVVCVLLGKKPQMIKAYQKIHVFTEANSNFSCKSWEFSDENTKKVWTRLSDRDKELFNFDMTNIEWDFCIKSILLGIRAYILKESLDSIPAAKRRSFFLFLGHRVFQFSFLTLCFWIISKFIFPYDTIKTYLMDSTLTQTGPLGNST